MLFMEIYGSLGNANVINIYLQHVSKWPSCPRFAFKIKLLHLLKKKKRKLWSDTESALQCKSTQWWFFFFFFWKFCHISGGFLPPLPRKNSLPSLSKYLSLCVSVPRWRRGEQSGAFVLPECLSQKMWTVPRISWAEIYLMHPHRVLLKSILGYGACQALSLVIYACYSLRERVHRPSLCRDHMDHTKVIEYENIEGWLCI